MNEEKLENDPELQRVLWACYRYWQAEPSPPSERNICYAWALGPYKQRFGAKFHPSKLRQLAGLGFLKQKYVVRGGNRRHYVLVDPDRIGELLQEWKLA